MRLIDADHLRRWILSRVFKTQLSVADIIDQIDREDTIEPDPDTVSRKAVLDALVTYREDMMHHFEVCYGAEKNRIDDCIGLIKNLPPLPTQSRPQIASLETPCDDCDVADKCTYESNCPREAIWKAEHEGGAV